MTPSLSLTNDLQGRFWSGRRVAVTGATGFVGYHVTTQLATLGAKVVALVRATSDRSQLEQAGVAWIEARLEDRDALAWGCEGCELVFHVAGAVDFENDWERFRRVNIEGTRNVLAAARAAGVRRLIHTSSIVAVGAAWHPGMLDESTVWNLGRLRVPYLTTKRIAEELARSASGRDLEVVVVNPASVLGPDDFSHSEFGTLCRRFWRGRIPFYFGGGNNFVDVRDVAAGHLLAARSGRPGERYILGGANRTYSSFFSDLARLAPHPIVRFRLPSTLGSWVARLNEKLAPRRASRSYLTPAQARLLSLFFYFDSAKARRELGYTPRQLPDSLRDTYQFWMNPRKTA